jgi:ABC-type antimicrobial peptide transport system permease subunit
VRQQEREIGVRLALGAPPRGIVAMVVRDGSRLAIAGLLAGIPAALLLAGVMQGVVFGIAPHDPATFVVLPAVVLAATLAASYLPARRASAVDPLTTIKRE